MWIVISQTLSGLFLVSCIEYDEEMMNEVKKADSLYKCISFSLEKPFSFCFTPKEENLILLFFPSLGLGKHFKKEFRSTQIYILVT